MSELDDEVKRINHAERKAKQLLRKNGYREEPHDCCMNCTHHISEYGEESQCGLAFAESDGFYVASVSELGLCDKFSTKFSPLTHRSQQGNKA